MTTDERLAQMAEKLVDDIADDAVHTGRGWEGVTTLDNAEARELALAALRTAVAEAELAQMSTPNVKQTWEDCSIGFICPHCGAQQSADTQIGPEKCYCGAEYYLSARLVITPPKVTP